MKYLKKNPWLLISSLLFMRKFGFPVRFQLRRDSDQYLNRNVSLVDTDISSLYHPTEWAVCRMRCTISSL